jgi:hypothetical protein
VIVWLAFFWTRQWRLMLALAKLAIAGLQQVADVAK